MSGEFVDTNVLLHAHWYERGLEIRRGARPKPFRLTCSALWRLFLS
jgi:hypothetical protein